MWSLLFILQIIKALIKSRDLCSSFVGFLLSTDAIKRLIYDGPFDTRKDLILFPFLGVWSNRVKEKAEKDDCFRK